MVDEGVSDACRNVRGECFANVEEVQARARRVRSFSLSEEACISIAASSHPFGGEGGESCSLSLAEARHPWCSRALPGAESCRRQEQNEKVALQVLRQESAYSCACAPWTGGDMKARDAMVVCSDRQGGRCMLRHMAREKPPQKRVRSKRHSWTSKSKASP